MKIVISLLILMSLLITEAVAQDIAPGAPTNFRVTVSDRKVVLSWEPPSNTGTYPILDYQYQFFRSDQTAIWLVFSGGDASTRSHTLSLNRNNELPYTLRVRARSYDGMSVLLNGTPSAAIKVEFRIPAPTDFRATAGDGQVTLNWTAPPVVAAITDYEYSQNGGTWTSIGSTNTSYSITTGVENGISYAFRVRAVRTGTPNEYPYGRASRTVTVTPLRDAPETPGTLNVQRVDDTATLTWSPPTSDTEEEIPTRYEYSDDGGSTWKSTGSTDTTYTVTGLEAGETYTFLVRAVYIDGTTSRIISHRSRSSNAAVLTLPKPKRRIIIQECPVGWQKTNRFGRSTRRVLIYEVNLEMDLQSLGSIYKPISVAIYVHPDEALESLDGWKLQVAIPYNYHRDYLLTAENSVVVDSNIEGVEGGFAFIENPEEVPFPMTGMGFTGATVPGFDYRLYDESGGKVDFGIACYKRGGIFQALRDMEDPRVLRNVLLESLDWDAAIYIRSEWTVPAPAPAAPSLTKKTVVGTWADLKKQ